VAFATNDERTAKRLSDAIGSTTEMRSMRNYAGHRLAPWLSHVMVSRQETARQLITPGEIMQLPSHEELILLSGFSPIKADKVRYYADKNFTGRVFSPPQLSPDGKGDSLPSSPCVWGARTRPVDDRLYTEAEKNTQNEIASALNKDDGGKDMTPDLDQPESEQSLAKETDEPLKDAGVTQVNPSINIPDFVRQSSVLTRAHAMGQTVEPSLEV